MAKKDADTTPLGAGRARNDVCLCIERRFVDIV
jgi:hypothetical protein